MEFIQLYEKTVTKILVSCWRRNIGRQSCGLYPSNNYYLNFHMNHSSRQPNQYNYHNNDHGVYHDILHNNRAATTRTITDMYGTQITVPAVINRVISPARLKLN